MSDVLDKARQVIEARTPGPWSWCHGDGFDHWELWNPVTTEWIVQDDSGVEPSTENLKFIALMGTVAEHYQAVAEAAKAIAEIPRLEHPDCVSDWSALRTALVNLDAKLAEALK